MFDIFLTVVIFHSVSALALFVVFALSSSAKARRQAAKAQSTVQADEREYSTGYSHG